MVYLMALNFFYNLKIFEDIKTLTTYVQYFDLELDNMFPKKTPQIMAKWCAPITFLQH
jgi:hypothetical protein